MNECEGAGRPGEDADVHLSAFCPAYRNAIELIGRRWTGAILRAMLSGEARFSDIVATVPGLSDRLLSERLKELEDENRRLKQLVADLSLDNQMLKHINRGNW